MFYTDTAEVMFASKDGSSMAIYHKGDYMYTYVLDDVISASTSDESAEQVQSKPDLVQYIGATVDEIQKAFPESNYEASVSDTWTGCLVIEANATSTYFYVDSSNICKAISVYDEKGNGSDYCLCGVELGMSYDEAMSVLQMNGISASGDDNSFIDFSENGCYIYICLQRGIVNSLDIESLH